MALSTLAALLLLAVTPEQQATLKRTAAVEAARVAKSPEDVDALERLGATYIALEQPKKAVAPLRQLLKLKDGPDSRLLLARALRLSGGADEARELLSVAIERSPKNA